MFSKGFRARGSLRAAALLAFTVTMLAGCGAGGGGALAPAPPLSPNTAPVSDGTTTINITQDMVNSLPSFSDLKYKVFPVRTAVSRQTMSVVYPLQLTNHGGHVLPTAQQHDVFINTTAAAVGTPQTFQNNFSNSTFVHVLDQYAGSTANNRYAVSTTTLSASLAVYSNMISQNQLFTVLHAAVAATHLSGYGHMYDLFLKPGLDTCFDFGTCYSPDVPSQFAFCAYHGSITFSDVGHVIFSVMPYQHTPGCGDDFTGLTLPNAVPIDDTATTLSHEESEAISDPDQNAWYNDAFGMEAGDNCAGFRASESLNAHTYLIQPEYSNSANGCFF